MSAAVNVSYAVVRGVIFVLLLALIGTQTSNRLVGRIPTIALSDPLRQRIRSAVPWLLALLAVAVLLRGLLQVLSFVDPGDPVTVDLFTGLLLAGSWGHAWTAQACVLIALTLWTTWRRSAIPRVDGVLLAGLAIVVWTQSGMGHANGENWHGPWGRLLDCLHITGAGIWLGTLAVLMIVALPALRGADQIGTLARLIREFSTYAKVGVTLIVASGTIAAVVYAGSLRQFVGATWGRLLLVKVAAMGGVVALGWYNWRIVTPGLERSDVGIGHKLRRAIRIELVLGLVLLAITAILVATALPGES
jgi:putative copper resistance protein D